MEELCEAFRRCKQLADQKKDISDADLQAPANQEILGADWGGWEAALED